MRDRVQAESAVRARSVSEGLPHDCTAGCLVWGSELCRCGTLGLVWQPG